MNPVDSENLEEEVLGMLMVYSRRLQGSNRWVKLVLNLPSLHLLGPHIGTAEGYYRILDWLAEAN